MSSQVAKAISSMDGQAYVLRRIDGRQVIPTAELLSSAEAAVGRWEPVANHPNLVRLPNRICDREAGQGSSLPPVGDVQTKQPAALFHVPSIGCTALANGKRHALLLVASGCPELPALLPMQVGLRDAFVSADWDGSPSLFFAHDYHPGAVGAWLMAQAEERACCACAAAFQTLLA